MIDSKKKMILKAEKIEKSYPMGKSEVLNVLKGIDLKIYEGEILAVMGPSGVGKSTLLHILGTLDRPTAGEIDLHSTNVFNLSDHELSNFRNRMIGFVFQFHHLLPEFSALENVAIPGLIANQKAEIVYEKANGLLKEVGLEDRLHHKPRELSGGEQQRVAFARSLVNDPIVIFADEPSGNLDMTNSQTLHELIWSMVKEKNKSFVIVTHNRELAMQADRIIELYDGKIKI